MRVAAGGLFLAGLHLNNHCFMYLKSQSSHKDIF